MSNRPIVGICRFSFLGMGDWAAYKESRKSGKLDPAVLARVKASLYSEQRLSLRFALFENLLVPSLAAQTDTAFTFIVLTSPELPAPYLARLKALEARLPMMTLVISKERSCKGALQPVLHQVREHHGQFPIQFRVDDDDCLANNYIHLLRQWSSRFREDRAFALSFPKTIVMSAYSNEPVQYYNWFSQFHSAGCAYYSENPNNTIFSYSHIRFPHAVPSLIVPYTTSAFITKFDGHDADDIFRHNAKNDLKHMDKKEVEKVLKIRFPFIESLDQLAALQSTH